MKKFNRILSFLMALVLLFSLAPAASAAMSIHSSGLFSDDKHRSMDYREAEELLTKLGIVPDQSKTTLNRAETADMLARTALAEYTAEEIVVMYGQGENPFTDVTNEEWSQGHISYVTKTGILEGRNENTFDPSETLNYDDLVYIPIYAGESTTSSRIPEDAEELETNKPFDNYNDRYQSESREAAQIVVDADLIPTYKQQKLYNLYVNAPYTWNDAAQLIAVLELGEEEAAKLEDPVEYARGKGYIPEGKERQHPLTGTDLVRILSMLMGSKVWLESSAGQFASLYGLLEDTTGLLSQANTNLETMEDHTKLNQLLAHPLKRDNAMQMIYNFLKASMPDGNGTVAEHFGVDMAKYVPPKVMESTGEVVHYTVSDVIPADTTVNVSVDKNGEITVTQGGSDVPGTDGEEVQTYAVQVDSPITVETLYHIITQITQNNTDGTPTTVFHIGDDSTWGNVDSYTVTVDENGTFSGSTVTFVPTDDGDYHVVTEIGEDYTGDFLGEAWEFLLSEEEPEDELYGLPEYAVVQLEYEEEETTLLDYDSESEKLFLNPGEYELPVIEEIPGLEDPGALPLPPAVSMVMPASDEIPVESPSAEAPPAAEEPPAAEPPAAEPPAAEPPAAEPPTAEPPAAVSPAAEPPAAEPPAAKPPAAEPPAAEPPAAEPPAAEPPAAVPPVEEPPAE